VNLDVLSAWVASGSALVSLLGAITAAIQLSKARRLRSIASRVDSLESDWLELQALIRRMDARDRMRSVRAAKEESSTSPTTPTKRRMNGRPDPITQPAEWKAWMRENFPPGAHAPKE
jgi:hypothetical protein